MQLGLVLAMQQYPVHHYHPKEMKECTQPVQIIIQSTLWGLPHQLKKIIQMGHITSSSKILQNLNALLREHISLKYVDW